MLDSQRIQDIYRLHAPAVYRRARQVLGEEEQAQEVVQDLFISLVELPEQFDHRSSMTIYHHLDGLTQQETARLLKTARAQSTRSPAPMGSERWRARRPNR